MDVNYFYEQDLIAVKVISVKCGPSLYQGFEYTAALIMSPNTIKYVLCHTKFCEML
jgi:hypothetical protein